MVATSAPTARRTVMTADQKRYRLRHRLLRARLDAGMSQAEVAGKTGWHVSKLNRIENGYVSVSIDDLSTLAECYGIPEPYDDLRRLTQGSQRLTWAKYKVLSKETVLYFGYESFAETIRNFENRLVPGLLQTPEYTRMILTAASELPETDAEQHLAVRQQRQQLLTKPDGPHAYFILDEAIFRRSVGGQILENQIARLYDLAELPRVTIEVLPFTAGTAFAIRGPFVHLKFRGGDDLDVLYLESKAGTDVFPTDPEVTARYKAEFEALRKLSVDLREWTA